MLIEKLKKELEIKNISIYKLSKITNIRYELLRRVFSFQRKLTAEELILILEKTGVSFEKIK